MKPICAALLVALMATPPLAVAAPKAKSSYECALAADMALVARALAEDKIDRDKASSIMARIYTAESERGRDLVKAIIGAAFHPSAPSAAQFSELLGQTCMRANGDMDSVLGVSL